MRKDRPRVLLATQAFPPLNTGGSAELLTRLLCHLPEDLLVVVHGVANPPWFLGGRLPFTRSLVLVANNLRWTLRCSRYFPHLYIALIRRRIEALARHYNVERIYAHFPNACFFIAAYQAAETLGLPLTVYFDILWEESNNVTRATLARKYERTIVRRADTRFAITEFAVDYLSQKHGVRFELLPHTTDTSNLPSGLVRAAVTPLPVIHFAGRIYPQMNQDAIVRLLSAVEVLRPQPVVDLCSPIEATQEQALGLPRDLVRTRFLSSAELRAAQQQSGLLYLPQAFESDVPTMIRHNLPTKTLEYLCTGKPILVHSPADSYLSMLAAREGFALVVDQPDPYALAAGIHSILKDSQLQAHLVTRALAFVKTRDSKVWAHRLQTALTQSLTAQCVA
ncbi:MAG: glycosyltransferase family 4 protein [Candidatus Binatia bacterium]